MKISVIIPAFNEEKVIESTLKAIKNVEVIVVCNGCTDNTAKIARKYADKVIVLKKKGVSQARNAGAKAASHNRLVFLDADIRVDKNVLKEINKSSLKIGTCKARADSNKLIDKVVMYLKNWVIFYGTCTGLIFCDRKVFDKVGGFNEKKSKGEDGKFIRSAMKFTKYGTVKAYLYNNMRRYRKYGHLYIIFYWIKEALCPSKSEYKPVR